MLKWRTADGRELSPQEMTTEHLKNTIAFIKSKIGPYCYELELNKIAGAMLYVRGDHAMDALDNEMDQLSAEIALERNCPIYFALKTELRSRNQ